MSALGIVPDLIVSVHRNPLGNGTILFLFCGQKFLDPESLMRKHGSQGFDIHRALKI